MKKVGVLFQEMLVGFACLRTRQMEEQNRNKETALGEARRPSSVEEAEAAIEAVLFAMGDSVELGRIAKAIGHDTETTRRILNHMMEKYNTKDRGIHIVELENAYQMCTKQEYYDYLVNIAMQPKKAVLTDVMMETLSIIAYKQPVTKQEIDKIRGVQSDHAVNKLVEYDLVQELGRLGELMDEKYTVESRMMLDVSVVREGRVIYSNLALNEAVVTRGAVSRVIRLHIRTEQGRLLDVTGDGVIVASPTGSTAYSLSAGGPVVEPTARNLIVSPICAHSVHANSYVLSPERTVTVQTEKTGYKPIFLSADGGRAFSLRNGDAVEIRRSKYETKLVRLSNKSFCDILQKKMLMGVLGHEE